MTRQRRMRTVLGAAITLSLLAAACSDDSDDANGGDGDGDGGDQQSGSTLHEVREREELICGVNDEVPGFGLESEEGLEGFDIDFCRVVAAAVLGDADAVTYEPLTAETRFTALQSGEIDVLIRNTTWTATRDGSEGATFLTTTFYDGATMMVKEDSGFESIDDMDGTTICVTTGTSTELNLASRFSNAGMTFEPRPTEGPDEAQPQFESDACQGWTSDMSQLTGIRSVWPEEQGGPEALTILEEEVFSKEPLGPVVRDNDSDWAQAVDWAVQATMIAEELDINQDNLEEMLDSDNGDVVRFLGQPVESDEGEAAPFDPGLALDPDFAVNIVEQVGNYGEIYDRHLGPDTSLELDRETFNDGANMLWNEGGLHYPKPYL